jgi:hypothetical protein
MGKRHTFLFYLSICVLPLIYLLINFDLLTQLVSNLVIPGWDGAAHLSIGQVYAEQIFPFTWGWVDNWYLGIPFPQFYPPAFYFLIALFSKVLFFFEYEVVFRLFVVINLIITPVLFFILSHRYFKKIAPSFLATLILVLMLSFRGGDSNLGVNFSSVVQVGLYAQLLSFNFFLAWLYFALFDEYDSKIPIKSSIFFSLIFLSNAHVAIPSVIMFFVIFLYTWRDKKFKFAFQKFFSHGIISVGLSAFWVFPMLNNYQYFVTKTLSTPLNIIYSNLINFYYTPLFCLIALIFAKKERDYLIEIISTFILLLSLISVIGIYVPEDFPLPLHFARWFSMLAYLTPIIIVYSINKVITISNSNNRRLFTTCFLVFLFFVTYLPIFEFRNLDGVYENEKIIPLLDSSIQKIYENESKPLISVEFSSFENKPGSFFIDSYFGLHGVNTIFSNIRESSLNSLFLTPLRNLLSAENEAWGIQSFLVFEKSFQEWKDWKYKIDLAKYFGVTHMLISSEELQENEYIIENTTLIDKNYLFEVRKIDNEREEYSKLKTAPVAFIGENGFKDRSLQETTFSRLGEVWMEDFDPNVVFVKNTSGKFSDPSMEFSRGVVLANDIKEQLDMFNNGKLTNFLNEGKFVYYDNSLVNESAVKQINFQYPDQLFPYYYINPKGLYQDVKYGEISNEDLQDDIYLIKKTYFPAFTYKNKKTYLASPAFMLVKDEDFNFENLYFEADKSVRLGTTVSLVSIILILLFQWKRNKLNI